MRILLMKPDSFAADWERVLRCAGEELPYLGSQQWQQRPGIRGPVCAAADVTLEPPVLDGRGSVTISWHGCNVALIFCQRMPGPCGTSVSGTSEGTCTGCEPLPSTTPA